MNNPAHSLMTRRRQVLGTLGTWGLGILGTTTAATASGTHKGGSTYKQYTTFLQASSDKNLKVGSIIETRGYHQIGDLGAGVYRVIASNELLGDKSIGAIQLENGLGALLLHEGFVNYALFGTHSNGKDDDGIAIKLAHEYANSYGIPIVNTSGEYWIQGTRNIPIKTNTNWGKTIFHINEQFNLPQRTNFEVLSDLPPIDIQLSAAEKQQLLLELKPGARYVPSLESYKNHMICIVDDQDRIGVRYGDSYKGTSWAKEDFFYVEEGGVILGDIAWEFSNITKLTAYPANNSYLIVDGGTFLVSGDSPGKQGGPYHQGGITVRRSRTIVRNQWVGLEKGKQDLALTPRAGFYTFSYVYDVLLENVRLIPWEQKRAEEERIVRAGTYGIGGNRILNATFRNVTAEGNMVHWGVFGTNLNKNFVIENCQLNRVDVHFHCWNITIRNSKIGQRGITLTGGGRLVIENTTVYHNQFVNMRQDYGGKWDGPIHIENCTLIPQTNSESAILVLVPADFDYQYPIVVGHQITIDNFCIDYSMAPTNKATAWAIRFPGYGRSSTGKRVIFPNLIRLHAISTQFREMGIRLFHLPDVSSLQVISGSGTAKEDQILTNASFYFTQIQLEKPTTQSLFNHFSLAVKKGSSYLDTRALYPKIMVRDCHEFAAALNDSAGDFIIEHSTITQFSAGTEEQKFQGELLFDHCRFSPVRSTEVTSYFPISTTLSTTFSNCLICPPTSQGQTYFDELDRYSFITLNKAVRFNHINTRLSKSLLRYLQEKKVMLKPTFIAMLKNHHELESEYI